MPAANKINLVSLGAQYGALAGLGCIIYTLLLYLINIELVLGFWIMLGYLIVVGAKFLVAFNVRKAQQNFINFKDGLKVTFMVSVVGLLAWIIFNAILFLYVDTQLITISRQAAIERTEKLMKMSGASDETIDEMLEKVKNQDYTPTLRTTSLNYASALFVGFLFSLVIAGVFYLISKDNLPVIHENSTA